MRTIALLFALPAAIAYAQANPAPAASPAPPAEPAVEQTASPELVGELVKEVGGVGTMAAAVSTMSKLDSGGVPAPPRRRGPQVAGT